ncbi:hypothetical protein EI94DRAFT_610605 [Lactarius quietus]|nr:hypothetical protein EI94DRAFT_1204512 [Lactarius quietus]KAF8263182.1 hypothetical protein EI94DRAFT_610605 [Lactarius quietus]
MGIYCSGPATSAIAITGRPQIYGRTQLYLLVLPSAGCNHYSSLYTTLPDFAVTYFNRESTRGYHRSMAGNHSKPPFLFLFVIGLLTVVVLSTSTFALVTAWRYFRVRGRRQSSIDAFALPTIVEEGRSTSDALDFSCRGPSRLGGVSPMVDEETGPQLKSTVRGGMDDGSLPDVKHLDSGASQNSTHPTTVSAAERVEQVEDYAQRTKNDSVPVDSGNSGDMVVDLGQSQSFVFPTPPKDPPLPPPAPQTPGGRLSMSTVWSQESMWPRERKMDFPMPPLAYLPVPHRVRPSPLLALGPPSPRSMSSFPRSVAASDFGDDYF